MKQHVCCEDKTLAEIKVMETHELPPIHNALDGGTAVLSISENLWFNQLPTFSDLQNNFLLAVYISNSCRQECRKLLRLVRWVHPGQDDPRYVWELECRSRTGQLPVIIA